MMDLLYKPDRSNDKTPLSDILSKIFGHKYLTEDEKKEIIEFDNAELENNENAKEKNLMEFL